MSSFLEKMFVIEGIIFGVLGILFFIFPIETIMSMSTIIAVLFVIVGISTIIRTSGREERWFFIFNGIINILFGLVLWLYPLSTINILIFSYGIWVLVRGIYLLLMSLTRGYFGLNAYTVYNVILILFGVIVVFQPFTVLMTAPYLIVTFTGNVNNFNVIYLLSGGDPVTDLASTAGKTDLLVTWLYKLTIDKQYYNIGAVIGILTFIILAVGALLTYRNSKSYKEGEI